MNEDTITINCNTIEPKDIKRENGHNFAMPIEEISVERLSQVLSALMNNSCSFEVELCKNKMALLSTDLGSESAQQMKNIFAVEVLIMFIQRYPLSIIHDLMNRILKEIYVNYALSSNIEVLKSVNPVLTKNNIGRTIIKLHNELLRYSSMQSTMNKMKEEHLNEKRKTELRRAESLNDLSKEKLNASLVRNLAKKSSFASKNSPRDTAANRRSRTIEYGNAHSRLNKTQHQSRE